MENLANTVGYLYGGSHVINVIIKVLTCHVNHWNLADQDQLDSVIFVLQEQYQQLDGLLKAFQQATVKSGARCCRGLTWYDMV